MASTSASAIRKPAERSRAATGRRRSPEPRSRRTTETKLSDTCYSDYDDTVSIFYTSGKKNNFPHGKKQVNTAVGPNLWCADAGTSKVDYWKYPAGGNPTGNLTSPPGAPYGAAVSIGK